MAGARFLGCLWRREHIDKLSRCGQKEPLPGNGPCPPCLEAACDLSTSHSLYDVLAGMPAATTITSTMVAGVIARSRVLLFAGMPTLMLPTLDTAAAALSPDRLCSNSAHLAVSPVRVLGSEVGPARPDSATREIRSREVAMCSAHV